MERHIPKEQLRLFDNNRYIQHHFLIPNVVELRPIPEDNKGHDEFIDNLEAEELRCRVFDFPRRLPPEDLPPEAA